MTLSVVHDVAFGGQGSDSVFGGNGNDVIAASDLFNRELTAEDYEQFRDGELTDDENGNPLFANLGLTGEDDGAVSDMLSGGAGNDTIFLGNADVARGGDGKDDFILGDWINEDSAAEITDFSAKDDMIIVAVQSLDAVVTTQIVDGVGQVLVDGAVVANIAGDFAEGDLDANIETQLYVPTVTAAPDVPDETDEPVELDETDEPVVPDAPVVDPDAPVVPELEPVV